MNKLISQCCIRFLFTSLRSHETSRSHFILRSVLNRLSIDKESERFLAHHWRNLSTAYPPKNILEKLETHPVAPAMGKKKGRKDAQDFAVPGRRKRVMMKAPSSVNLVVVGTGGPGTSGSVLLTTEYSRYLFNCGEGTQRMGAVSKGMRASAYAKLSGLEHIFVTHKSWENTGGLLGLAMALEGQMNPDSKAYTTRDQHSNSGLSAPKINLYGPQGVEHITLMAKKFSQQMNLKVLRAEGEWSDAAVTISPVVLKTAADPSTDSDLSEPESKKARTEESPSPSSQQESYAYICKAKPVPPKINIEKCFDAGVTIGPMVGQLQKGFPVTLDDGTVVHPHQVTDLPNQGSRPILIVECPTEAFLPALESSPQLSEHWDPPDPSKAFSIVVHFSSVEIFNSPPYQAWMKKCSPGTDHLVVNRDSAESDLPRAREHQTRLSMVSTDIFPSLPKVDTQSGDGPTAGAPNGQSEGSVTSEEGHTRSGRTVKACSGLVYTIRGKELGFHVDHDEVDVAAITSNLLSEPDIKTELARLKGLLPTQSEDKDTDEEVRTKYPKVVFLGTGSSEPNKIRNHSCITVQLSKHSAIILDCGEDSHGQLYRFFGRAKAARILHKVKAIFVSHMHGDHHLGLFTLLKERQRAFEEKGIQFEPVILMAPIQITRWLRFYHFEVEPVMHLFRLLKLQKDVTSMDPTFQTATEEELKDVLRLTEYQPVEVNHCPNAFGLTLTHCNGFKLVYSGDTRPCNSLIDAGMNCDLLIHEATHEDSLIKNAQVSKHTTFSEAMTVGKKMQAKHVILTHFSQRYAHMVPLEGLSLPDNVGVAFDNMQVVPSTLGHLPKLIPALTAIFGEELQKIGLKAIKRTRTEETS